MCLLMILSSLGRTKDHENDVETKGISRKKRDLKHPRGRWLGKEEVKTGKFTRKFGHCPDPGSLRMDQPHSQSPLSLVLPYFLTKLLSCCQSRGKNCL